MQTPARPVSGRPRIGIPVRLSSSEDPDPRVGEANGLFDYIVGLLRDGGADPVLLTSAEGLAGLDGAVLPGGGDLDPRLYGEEPGEACYDVNHGQDALDLAVARQSIDAGLPVLGICRGHQLLNVLYGGSLVQDMDPGAVAHREPSPRHGAGPWAWHEVGIAAGSKVAGLYGSGGAAAAVTVKIASGHHQAVARVADGLVVSAVADDGTVEALEDPARWVASVQWHPEALELPAAERLAPFRAFVEVCRNRAASR
ncbi:gamma-glutamyl-gamma-aminobutyrate hydrolase family protein [Arthrobacter sp. UKPF54-2]|uniref:gamma-glutamyl-gamma-aminobutyrate hydrolase family protein n=1 Tax=Arthrobacter sp. UKPF54-2 TaxID=2600159 RepID=UPI0011B14729|nr:gamma-glutamyl-gamma-aminobutyrate hydrolase family protein [Arthrobacter sp. UKPF54-2]QDY89132.1 gamma-glutamyl-gamma-aminobutyrate hydrolase family protein [Arthrobacter sp. UKPF54-2]